MSLASFVRHRSLCCQNGSCLRSLLTTLFLFGVWVKRSPHLIEKDLGFSNLGLSPAIRPEYFLLAPRGNLLRVASQISYKSVPSADQ